MIKTLEKPLLLNIKTSDKIDTPNTLTQKVIREAEQGINLSKPFNTIEDLMADLNACD